MAGRSPATGPGGCGRGAQPAGASLTAKTGHGSAISGNWCVPRSVKEIPEPATRSLTVREASTSPARAARRPRDQPLILACRPQRAPQLGQPDLQVGGGPLGRLAIAGLTGIGISSGAAVAAVVIYRLATYWLPVPPGWLSWRLLQRLKYV
jgi:hypothetical protein